MPIGSGTVAQLFHLRLGVQGHGPGISGEVEDRLQRAEVIAVRSLEAPALPMHQRRGSGLLAKMDWALSRWRALAPQASRAELRWHGCRGRVWDWDCRQVCHQ